MMVDVDPAPVLFTVEDYVRMGELGLLDEDLHHELIDGVIYEVPPTGEQHAFIVTRLIETLNVQLAKRAIVRPGLPLIASRRSMPEPDAGVFAYRADYYRSGHPTAADLLVVIEVSHSTFRFDSTKKMSMYARAGVPHYWIIDVVRQRVLVHSKPSDVGYAEIVEEREGVLAVPGTDATVDLRDYLVGDS